MFCHACARPEEEEEIIGEEEDMDPETWRRGISHVEMKSIKVNVRSRKPRTTKDAPVPPKQALEMLKLGNQRFSEGVAPLVRKPLGSQGRKALVDDGQRPCAIVLGCADSRVPSDTIFDQQPGDLFILRNAGNTLTKAEGSVVGSMEYAVAHLEAKLILVLGHSYCGAIAAATKVMLERKAQGIVGASKKPGQSALEVLLDSLAPVAEMTAQSLPHAADEREIAEKAVKVNVFHSVATVLLYSKIIRDKVRTGEVEVHGGYYDLETGVVEFLGPHPLQERNLLRMHLDIPHTGPDGHGIAIQALGA